MAAAQCSAASAGHHRRCRVANARTRRAGYLGIARVVGYHSVVTFVRPEETMSEFHALEMLSITGEPVSLSKFQDNLCLVVNVASR
jgi:hypothetical protein